MQASQAGSNHYAKCTHPFLHVFEEKLSEVLLKAPGTLPSSLLSPFLRKVNTIPHFEVISSMHIIYNANMFPYTISNVALMSLNLL